MNIGAVLIDIDGVLHVGDRPVEGAGRALRELDRRGIPCRSVSSTTRSSRRSVAQRLHRLGYEIPEPWIVTAPAAAAVDLRESGRTRCCLLTTPDARADLEENGISAVDGGADAVVVGGAGGALTCERLNRAFRLLMEGAGLIALENDRYWMEGDGPMLSAGPVVAAIEYAAGIEAEVIGKPSPAFFQRALQGIGARPLETAMRSSPVSVVRVAAV